MEYHLWRLQPFGYHLVNVLVHTLNALFLWKVLRRLNVAGAWVAAAIFAIHPVEVESVAWVSELKNLLSTAFYLGAVLAFVRFRPLSGAAETGSGDWRFYWLAIGLFVCALLSKTVACSLPVALVLLIWWKTGRVERRDVAALGPMFALGIIFGLTTAWLEKYHNGARGAEWSLSFLQRNLLAGRALWFYAAKVFWPAPLTFNYPRWDIDAGLWWQYVFPFAALAVLLALWRLRSRIGRGPLVAVLYFAVTLAPALGFVNVFPFLYSYVADHFQYLACIGLIALTAGAGAATCQRAGPQVRSLGKLAAVLVLVLLGVSTWKQAHIYKDLETLWRDTLAKNPSAWLAHNNLSNILIQQGKFEEATWHLEQALRFKPDAIQHYNLGLALARLGQLQDAIAHYEQALRLKPDYAEADCDLGIALAQTGRTQEAVRHFERALKIKPDYVEAHDNLGVTLVRLGRITEAKAQWEQALRLKPDDAGAHANLANALKQEGRLEEAVAHYEQALRIDPALAGADYNLGLALARLGRLPDAITHYEQALRLKPGDAETHRDLGNALAQTGRLQEAMGHWEQALRLKSDSPEVQNDLAWLYATLATTNGGDPVRAVTLAERACGLTNNRLPEYLDTLAAAYASAGRFDDAITVAQKAIGLARSEGRTPLAGEIDARLELYRAGRAYRAPASGSSPQGR